MIVRKKEIKKYQLEEESWKRRIFITVVSLCSINISLLIFFSVAAEFDFSKISAYFLIPLITLISSPLIYYLRFCIREYRISNNLRNSITLNGLLNTLNEEECTKINAA